MKPTPTRRKFKSNLTPAQRKLNGKRSPVAVLGGAFFAGIGLLFVFFILRDFTQDLNTYRWHEVPAVIDNLTIDYPEKAPRPGKGSIFTLNVEYTYSYCGKEYQGTNIVRDGGQKGGSYESLALVKRRMILDEVDSAYVNPDAPGNAVLKRGSLLFGLVALFPMIFVLLGLGIMAAGLGFASSGKSGELDRPKYKPGGKKTGWLGGVIFGAIFFAVGAFVFWMISLGPWLNGRNASNWEETPCEIVWSRVKESSGDDGTTYRPDIFYEYQYDDEQHRSNSYSFERGSSSGYRKKQKIVKQYPAGHETTCFVNPDVPERAVLSREMKQLGWWWLFPIPFMGAGLAIMIGSIRSRKTTDSWRKPGSRNRKASDSTKSSSNPFSSEDDSANSDQPLTLTGSATRRNSFLGITFVALFWNGIISIFVFQGAGLFDRLFMIPFVLIGAVMIAGWFYTLFGLMNPRATVQVSPANLKTGDLCRFQWTVGPRAHRIKHLQVYLEGTEQARYIRGTSHVTDNEVFFRKLLVDETDPAYIQQGIVEYELPSGLMPTLDLDDNKILWNIIVHGDIPRWPDVNDKMKIDLLPFDDN